MWLGQIYLLILFYSFFSSLVWVKSLPKMIFLFLLCVWFCSYSRSWPPCPCHWPHPDRYHWLGSPPPSPHLPLYNLSICFPTIHMFPIFHFIFFFFFLPLTPPPSPHLPSLQPFNLLPHHPHVSYFSLYNFLFFVIFFTIDCAFLTCPLFGHSSICPHPHVSYFAPLILNICFIINHFTTDWD